MLVGIDTNCTKLVRMEENYFIAIGGQVVSYYLWDCGSTLRKPIGKLVSSGGCPTVRMVGWNAELFGYMGQFIIVL